MHGLGQIERCLMVMACLVVLAAGARAQGGQATLSLSLQVQPSISLVFQNNPNVGRSGYCPLSNAGTNNVGLDLGTANSSGGDSLSCVIWANTGGATYQVSSAFDVVVSKSNSSSPNYTLSASISTPAPSGVGLDAEQCCPGNVL